MVLPARASDVQPAAGLLSFSTTGIAAGDRAGMRRSRASPELEAAADALRTQDVSLQSAIRWTRRRVKLVQGILASVLAVIPNAVGSCRPSVIEFQHRMNTNCVLYRLRETASAYLVTLPPPLGFGARRARNGEDEGSFQHDKGPDPPSVMP